MSYKMFWISIALFSSFTIFLAYAWPKSEGEKLFISKIQKQAELDQKVKWVNCPCCKGTGRVKIPNNYSGTIGPIMREVQ